MTDNVLYYYSAQLRGTLISFFVQSSRLEHSWHFLLSPYHQEEKYNTVRLRFGYLQRRFRSSSHLPTLHFLQVYQQIWQEVELFSKAGITERHNFWTVIKSKVIFWKHKFKKFFINLCLVGVLTGTLCLSRWSFFLFQSLVSTAAARVAYAEVMLLVMMYSCKFRGSNDLRRILWLQKYYTLYVGFGWF